MKIQFSTHQYRAFFFSVLFFPCGILAELNVVATTPDFGAIAKEIGGDKVEVIVLVLEPSQPASDVDQEKVRAAALDQFLALARSSAFRSAGPYPTRDELHERP